MKKPAREHVIQITVCACVLLVLTTVVCGMLIGWRHMPGLLGEWIGLMAGVITTPFLMESTFFVIGLTIVVFINHWRNRKSGDELMYLEQVDEAVGLPDHAAWALYRDPCVGEVPPLLVQAEGALAIGDHETAAQVIAAMPETELGRPEVLALRVDLARATGKVELAARLESELRKQAP
jgi:uncharacterized membrane protein